jgi:hypothetical protein
MEEIRISAYLFTENCGDFWEKLNVFSYPATFCLLAKIGKNSPYLDPH